MKYANYGNRDGKTPVRATQWLFIFFFEFTNNAAITQGKLNYGTEP